MRPDFKGKYDQRSLQHRELLTYFQAFKILHRDDPESVLGIAPFSQGTLVLRKANAH